MWAANLHAFERFKVRAPARREMRGTAQSRRRPRGGPAAERGPPPPVRFRALTARRGLCFRRSALSRCQHPTPLLPMARACRSPSSVAPTFFHPPLFSTRFSSVLCPGSAFNPRPSGFLACTALIRAVLHALPAPARSTTCSSSTSTRAPPSPRAASSSRPRSTFLWSLRASPGICAPERDFSHWNTSWACIFEE